MQKNKRIVGRRAELNIYFDSFNKRIRVDSYSGNLEESINLIESHADESKAEKIIIKARQEHLHFFIEKGYILEAVITGFFAGSDACFLAKFLSEERKRQANWLQSEKVFRSVAALVDDTKKPLHSITLHKAEVKDAERLSSIYKSVFPVYPVPLQKPEYVRKSIEEGTVFFYIEKNNEIISAASAEIDKVNRNAELTDCATLPSFRGGGLMKQLLNGLEEELVSQNIYCAYTIARSLSFGMNSAFKQLGYRFGGTLVNNCYIYDKIEDMNVWWKDLSTK